MPVVATRTLLASHAIKASLSCKGNYSENAGSETLFGALKVERLHGMESHNPPGGQGHHARLAALVQRVQDGYLSQLSWSNTHSPLQPEREVITPTRRKSKSNTLMSDAF
jgi:hypothetical protein